MDSHWNTAQGGYASSSTAQTGHQGDWQEEMYQRVKQLKDAYYPDLREIHQKLSLKINQMDIMVGSNVRAGDQIEKMQHYKLVLERMITVVSLSKHQMQMGLKDKLPLYEKQILHILHHHKKIHQQQSQVGGPSYQSQYPPPQQSQHGMQSQQTPEQQQSQQMYNHPNQLQQQLNTMTQPSNLILPNAMQQGVQNTLQADQLLESDTGFGSLQQGSMGPTNSMNPPQMVGSGAGIGSSNMSHAVTMGGMQIKMSSALVLKQQQQHQELIQPQQSLMPTQQQMQEHLNPTQQQMQQYLIQQHQLKKHLMQKQQLLQQQLPLLQQIQQEKPQHPLQNQMQQLNQPSDQTDIKSTQGATEEMGLRDNLPRYGKQILVRQQQSQAEANQTMDSNWSATQGGASMGPSSSIGADSSNDWRSQLLPYARQRIVNKVIDTLKRHLPVPVPEGLNELQKIAVRFEEKIYSAATSQPDYLRKISLKMLSMETKAQPAVNASLPDQNRIDPGVGMNSQQPGSNPGQSQQPQPLLQQLEQMDNHPNQPQPQLNTGTLTQSNSLSMPNAMQQGIQNTLQSDQLLTKVTEIGHPAYNSTVRKPRTCKICGDCVHKRRKVSD